MLISDITSWLAFMKFKTPLISIIVPIYNADRYLEECLSSIQSQSYNNFEAILINDGSIDGSKKIAEKYCERDNRFKLINQPNSGVASARQTGLNHINGEYVIHTDADDIMYVDALSHLYNTLVNNEANIAIGAYTTDLTVLITHDEQIDKETFISNLLDGKYHSSLWNKLISTDLIQGISFERDLNYMEDKLFLLKMLRKDGIRISVTNELVYFYRPVKGSYTNELSDQSILSAIKVTEKITNLFSDVYSPSFINHLKNKMRIIVLLYSKKPIDNIFPEANSYILRDKNISLKHKIMLLLGLTGNTQIYKINKKMYKLKTNLKSLTKGH